MASYYFLFPLERFSTFRSKLPCFSGASTIDELYDALLNHTMRWFTNLNSLSPPRDIIPSPQRTSTTQQAS